MLGNAAGAGGVIRVSLQTGIHTPPILQRLRDCLGVGLTEAANTTHYHSTQLNHTLRTNDPNTRLTVNVHFPSSRIFILGHLPFCSKPSSLWDPTLIEHPLPKTSLAWQLKEKRPQWGTGVPWKMRYIFPLGNDIYHFRSQFMGRSKSCGQGRQAWGGEQSPLHGKAGQEGPHRKEQWKSRDAATHRILREWTWDLNPGFLEFLWYPHNQPASTRRKYNRIWAHALLSRAACNLSGQNCIRSYTYCKLLLCLTWKEFRC